MKLLFISLPILLLISVTTVQARHDETCKETTLYPLTSPPGKAEHMILCHPVGKALAAANNANLQFNAGEMAAQNQNQNQQCPTGHTNDFCSGWKFAKNGFK